MQDYMLTWEGVSFSFSPKSCAHNMEGSVSQTEAVSSPALSHLHPACPPRGLVHVALKIGHYSTIYRPV